MKLANAVEKHLALQTFQILIRILLLDDPDEVCLCAGDADATLLYQCLKPAKSHTGPVLTMPFLKVLEKLSCKNTLKTQL